MFLINVKGLDTLFLTSMPLLRSFFCFAGDSCMDKPYFFGILSPAAFANCS